VPVVFACIAPHGGIAIAEACAPDERHIALDTRAAMEELGRRFDEAAPEVAIVFTPHNVHVDGAMAVVTSGFVGGILDGRSKGSFRIDPKWYTDISLQLPVDRDLACGIREAMVQDGIRTVGVSFGANAASAATFPMDWGVLVPLWFMGGRRTPPLSTVVVAPSRDLSYQEHVTAGRAIARAAASSPKRVALIASCDHGHGHDARGAYGFTPRSREFDEQVVELIKTDDLAGLLRMDPALPIEGVADSYWQMLMLHGALGSGWRGELLSYEAPTYFGMICASYSRVA
jgi:aromatic ring-opening dioxygenase LigB subunit